MGCWLFSFGFPWDAPFFGRSFRDVEGNNTVRVPNPALSADLLELTDFTLQLETLGAKPPPSPQRVPPHKMGSLRSFHPLGRIRTRCLLLAGKTICFALRLPPQHKSHAASTMIYNAFCSQRLQNTMWLQCADTRNTLKQPLQCSSTSFLGCRRGDDRVVVRRQGLSVPCCLQTFDII